jgi:hypothetical protein
VTWSSEAEKSKFALQDQTRDVRGALFDKGKYVLSKQAAVLKVSYETWTQLLPAQRSRPLLKFVNLIKIMKKAKKSIIFKNSQKLISRFKINESLALDTFISKLHLTK